MSKEISLNEILLSPAAVAAWHEMAKRIALALHRIGKLDENIKIPDERAELDDNGELTIFVEIPNIMKLSMKVPADQWSYYH